MNQNPEQLARDIIDADLIRCGWVIQPKSKINLNAASGVAIREYQTDNGPADYVLFVNKVAVGIIEAKRAEEGVHLTMQEEQTDGYRTARLKYLNNQPWFFGYESTGEVTRFTDYRDLCEKITTQQALLSSLHLWRAYEQFDQANASAQNELTALVGLKRTISGYDKTVDKNSQDWVFKKQAGTLKFTEEQMQWLRMIKDYVAGSFHVDNEDFELDPFNKQGGLGRFYQLFKEDYEKILEELNEALAA